jgi:hypothetical protein
MEMVRRPLRVRERSRRTLDQRLAARFPQLIDPSARLIGRLAPTSRVRQAVVWRSTRNGMEAFNRRDVDAAVFVGSAEFELHPRATSSRWDSSPAIAVIYWVREGKIVSGREYADRSTALEAVGAT